MSGYYDFKPELNGIERKARDLAGRFAKFQGAVLQVHKEAIAEMGVVAGDVLKERTHLREAGEFGRSGRLENAVRDPGSSSATIDGFQFLLADRMNEVAVYWRAIEHGSDHLVGREIHLEFMRGGQGGIGAMQDRRGMDSARINPGIWPLVTIRNPIPAYGYALAAETWFKQDDFAWYRSAMKRAAADRGLTLA